MAGKVNTKFAVILGGSVLALLGAVVLGAYLVMSKSALDNKKEAEAFLAQGETEKALGAAGKAVAKEPNNVEYLRYWVSVMEKTRPLSPQAYQDRYAGMLMEARRRIARVQRTNRAAHEDVLNPIVHSLRYSQTDANAWAGLIKDTETAMGFYSDTAPEEAKDKAILGRFRGIAVVEQMRRGLQATDDERKQAKSDLDAALAADPTLDDASAALAQWHLLGAVKSARDGQRDRVDQAMKDAKASLDQFLKVNPQGIQSVLARLQLELNDVLNAAGPDTPLAQRQAAMQPKVEEALTALEGADPAKVDMAAAQELTQIAVASRLPKAVERSRAVFEKISAARPTHPFPMIVLGDISMYAGEMDVAKAIAQWQKVVDMEELPLSLEGLMLFRDKLEARMRQVNAQMQVAESSTGPAKEEALKKAKEFRDAFVKESPSGNAMVALTDGRLAFLNGDLPEARRLLNQYVEQDRNNAAATRLLAEVMLRQGNLGSARTFLLRAVELNPNDVLAWRVLTEVQIKLADYAEAQKSVTKALALDPKNEQLLQQKASIDDMMAGTDAKDPVMRALAEAQKKINGVPQDVEGGKAVLKKAAETADSPPNVMRALARALFMMGERETAMAVVSKGLAKFPDNPLLMAEKSQIELASKVRDAKAIEEQIANFPGANDADRAMARFVAYTQLGEKEKAKAAFAEAKRLNPDHVMVVSFDFDEALEKKDMPTALALAEKAKALNLDKAGGVIFRARYEAENGRLPEAIAMMQQAAEADPQNPLAWRVLGRLRLDAQRYADAVVAMEKAVAIKPDDVESVIGLAQAKVMVGSPMEALKVCRDTAAMGAGTPEFVNLWLDLEMQYGDVAQAVDRRKRMFEAMPTDRANSTRYLALLLDKGDYPGAKAVMDKIEAQGNAEDIQPYRAMWHAAQGEKDQARAVWQQVLAKMKPEDQKKVEQHLFFARSVSQLGAFDLAVEILEGARALQSPDQMEADRELGDLYFQNGKFAEAMTAYQRAVDSIKVDTGSALTQRLGECAVRLKKFDEARTILAKAAPTEADEKARLALLKAEVESSQGKWDAARPFLDEAVAAQPRLWLVYYKRADCNYRDERFRAEAKQDLEQAIRLAPALLEPRALLAGILVTEGKPDAGVALLRDGLTANPGNVEMRQALINGLVRLGKPDEATALAEEAWNRSQDVRWAGVAGDMFANAKKWASAAKYYGELWAKEQSPAVAVRYVPSLMNLSTPDIATAKSVLASKVVDVEGNFIFRMQRAWVAMRDNRPKDAEADMVASWKMMKLDDPDMIGSFFREMARVYSRPGSETRYADAVKFTRERLLPEGKTDVAEFRLSQLMASDKAQEDAAFKEMERLAGAATTPWVISNAARLVGNTYYAQKNYEKALAFFKRGLEGTPNDAELLNNAGYTLSRHLNKPEEGLPLISKAAELAPGNTSVLDSKGTVQLQMKQLDEAEKTLTEALRAARTQFDQAAPILHLVEVKLEKGDRSAADDLYRRFRTLVDSENPPKRIEQAYREEIDRVQRRLQGGS